MKNGKFDFLWFEGEDRRRVLRASVCTDCRLHIGEELRRNLPEHIRLGFDKDNRYLALAPCEGTGIILPKNGIVNATALCKQLRQIGLTLPIVFEFEKDEVTNYYLGHIVPQRRTEGDRQYDVDQLMLIYQPMVDRIIGQLAKTTPKAERRAIAAAAMVEAVRDYHPSQGEIGAYLEDYLRKSLITENRQYTASYAMLSIDRTSRTGQENSFSLHQILTDQLNGGITHAENRIMAEQFMESLSRKERKLVELMRQEQKLPQIALELELSREEVIELGRGIGRKREAFYGEE